MTIVLTFGLGKILFPNMENTVEIETWSPVLAMEERQDGTIYVWREDPLGPYPDRVTDPLVKWAEKTPDRPWMAQRDPDTGDWRMITYTEALERVRRIAQFLIDHGVTIERPLVILSGNSIEHALMALGAQYAGIASAAISPAYSLYSKDYEKLRQVESQLTPGMIFAEDGAQFIDAIDDVFGAELPLVTVENPPDRSIRFDDVLKTEPTAAVERANQAVTRDTVAKFLFTSGTTGTPKAVVQSHGMIAANQAMALDCYAFLKKTPPIVVDWAPWNHTAAGTKVFYLVLFNGGTYYIDEGKPAPGAIDETVRNLREIAPTWYFNVPAGYDLLVKEMERDDRLRENFYSRLQYMMYAGAAMASHTWQKLGELSVRTIGRRVLRSSSLGSTETGPFALCGMEDLEKPDNIGIPAQGVTMKLVPADGKLELRLKSPAITPGYWRDEELTKQAFDEEGFYRLGDAVRFAEPGNPYAGFFFDGRIAENFKLRTGTFVAVGPLRGKLINEFGGLVRDAVIAGDGKAELGALLLPSWPSLRSLVPEGEQLEEAEIAASEEVRTALAAALSNHARGATGSANRVMRAILLLDQPSLDKGEMTDKGSLNQRVMLRNNAELVKALYQDDDPRVLLASTKEKVKN